MKIMFLLQNISKYIFTQLKTGHTERIYHNAFEIELRNQGIPYETEKRILYKYQDTNGDKWTLGEGRIDIFIRDKDNPVIVELKATSSQIKESEKNQLHKYMRSVCHKYPKISGLIVNFPQPSTKAASSEVSFYECWHKDFIELKNDIIPK